uniref:RNA-dependent RNA polymerase n=1 Tax=Uromyces fabae virus TaxID=3069272 RepID=A0AA51U973_9VIRU|nr:RNA-dependent RNA polymerase [Uromyces fabae virus]
MMKCAEEGQYTRHNREDLSKRWLNYAQERIEKFSGVEGAAIECATAVFQQMLDDDEVFVDAVPISEYGPNEIEERCNPGNSNDYKIFYGIRKRNDKEMISIGHRMFQRLLKQSDAISEGKAITRSDVYRESICTSFGKSEVVGSTIGVGGKKEKKNCRAIFPTSPVDYFKKTHLFFDLADALKEKCPCYGPGFAAGRGHDKKVLSLIEKCTAAEGVTTRKSEWCDSNVKIINRDMKHWDTRMSEAAILHTLNFLESRVNKDKLSFRDRNARKLVFEVAADEVLTKLVEHPSGYLLWVSGTLPSGTYVTSILNSVCNILLCIACPIYLALKEGKRFKFVDDILNEKRTLARIARDSVICNGDNQMGTDELYSFLGVSFSPSADDGFFSSIGMKVKIDECGNTERIDQCMFSQRKFLRLRGDLYPTRCMNALLKKFYAKPFTSYVDAKLYVRCMMIDYLAIDPLIFKILKSIDANILVAPRDLVHKLSTAGESYRDFMMNAFGRDRLTDDEWFEIVTELCTLSPSRKSILSLLLSKKERPIAEDSEIAAKGMITGNLRSTSEDPVDKYLLASEDRPSISKVAKLSPQGFLKIIKETGQTDIYFEMSETKEMLEN